MNFILIAICLLSGLVLRLSGILPENSHRGINAWILYIALPAVSLLYIPAITWSRALILPVMMPLLVWSGAWLLLKLFAQRFALDKGTHATLLLTIGLGNTSFIGFPLTQAYFGDEGLRIAVICDQASFLIFSTLGVMTALKASHYSEPGMKKMIKNIICFPSFLAFVAALILPRFTDFALLNPLLTKIASTLVPLALFSVGLQIRFSEWKTELRPLFFGLVYKLLFAPAIVFCAAFAFQLKGIIPQASVFEAAMAPMVTSAILADEYQLSPRLPNLIVSIGIMISIATTGLWYIILRTFF
jgi:malate permease and related proteins